VATGDFTHPAWRAELKRKLVPAEPGLFRLADDVENAIAGAPPAGGEPTRFMLSVEISTIYKKGELTRKIHHLVYAPDFDAADRIAARLARIGNIAADGRPILGLDSRDLLEITLESSPDAFLVPAHIWTPWFAVLGSRSGFDSIIDCYGDLSDHIFAVETGLSSDPPMNWRISFLDRYRLVSNSDAHSPSKLGREATLFDAELSYFAIRHALETGHGYVGTVEFFPEEGKYHLDGHRKCGIRLTPRETHENDGRCPACGERVTVGVLHRVEALADRAESQATPPASAGEVLNLVPLPEILSEIAGSGPSSQKVERSYERLLAALGPELAILEVVPLEDIARAESSLLAEAVARLRAGRVIREAGYDGEYGTIRLFERAELRRRTAGGLLFDIPAAMTISPLPSRPREAPRDALALTEASTAAAQSPAVRSPRRPAASPVPPSSRILAALDDDQRAAAAVAEGALLIMAGPGSGKTRTLTHRIAHLIEDRGVPAHRCVAVTFTRRAAFEMRSRLAALLGREAHRVAIHTFHSLGLSILREHGGAVGLHRGFRVAQESERAALVVEHLGLTEGKARARLRTISRAKRAPHAAGDDVAEAMAAYQRALALRNWIDFDDLVALAVRALASDAGLAALYQDRFRWIFVDEFQDVDEQQYGLLGLLAPAGANLCAIGDPDQAIYGFRGADASCFDRFKTDYPSAAVVTLARNYRSSGTIVTASSQIIAPSARRASMDEVVRDMHERLTIHVAPSERAEAEFVVHTIEQLIGGHSFFSIDSGRATDSAQASLSFADFAVLYRTDAQSAALREALARSGLPFKKHSHERLAERPAVRALLRELDHRAEEDIGDSSLVARLRAAAARLKRRDAAHDAETVETALQQLSALAATCDGDGDRFADAVAFATEADLWDPRADRISLLTLHAAKGLEFPVVFIVGLEDGILPLHWNGPDDTMEAEERRLLYVGMTRAKDRLVLSRAVQRHWRGRLRRLNPSPYLNDIEDALVRQSRMDALRKKPKDNQLKLL